MKLTKRIKAKRRNWFTKISLHCMPVGYYYNRPNIRNPYHSVEIGRVEGFRFIMSPNVQIEGLADTSANKDRSQET